MVTSAQLINRSLGQAVIYLSQKALSVGITSPDLSVIIIFFFLRIQFPSFCLPTPFIPPSIHQYKDRAVATGVSNHITQW